MASGPFCPPDSLRDRSAMTFVLSHREVNRILEFFCPSKCLIIRNEDTQKGLS